MIRFALEFGPRARRWLGLGALMLAGVGQGALADETKVYEWRDASGALSYSQQPPPSGTQGGFTSREIDTKTFTPAQQVAIAAHLARINAAETAGSKRFRGQVNAADRTVTTALRQLAAAERSMRTGRAPLADERVGNAGGGSRLRADYFDRQKQLEAAVQTAHAKVDEAYRLRAEIKP